MKRTQNSLTAQRKIKANLHKWWKLMFEVSPAAKSLRFPPNQKQRATYPVGFFPSPPPPLSADCIAETGLCGSTAPPLRRLLAHFPHAQCSLWDTSRHESPRSRHGGWVNEANTVLWTSILKYDLTQHVSTWKYANALSTLEKPQLNKMWHENGVECTFLSCHYCFVCI